MTAWLALADSLARLAAAILAWLRDRRLIAAGEARGRAAADAAHAAEAAVREAQMRGIAENPPAREEIEKKLEEGRA